MSNPLYHPQQLHGYGLNPLNTNYLPPYAYGEGQPQTAPPQQSSTPPQTVSRKRPKYQRSKQGCLSCRVRKVKCDEVRPICTRCSTSQRECTWPPDTGPKDRKGHGQAQSTDSNPGSRPSTSNGVTDNEWPSDTAAGGPFRTLPTNRSVNDTHSRNSSLSSLTGGRTGRTGGRPFGTGSANGSRNSSRSSDRGPSPNPFSYGIHQLGPPPASITGNHGRTESASSNGSVSSLPYPLVSAHQPPMGVYSHMGVPGLSTSEASSPASAPFGHSPTQPWHTNVQNHPQFGSRPASAGLVAGLGNIDLAGLAPSHFGLDSGEFNFASPFDSTATPGFVPGFDTAFGGGFDPTGASTGGFGAGGGTGFESFAETAGPFLTQLGGQDGNGLAYGNNGSPSSGSPNGGMMMDGVLDSHGHSTTFGGGDGGGGFHNANPNVHGHTTASMPGFHQAQTSSTAASGFGHHTSPVANTHNHNSANSSPHQPISPYRSHLAPPHQASLYGINSQMPPTYGQQAQGSYDPQAPQHPRLPASVTYGMEPQSHPQSSNNLTPATTVSSQYSPSPTLHSPINLRTTANGTSSWERTPPQHLHSEVGAGVGAGRYTEEAKVGPQEREMPLFTTTNATPSWMDTGDMTAISESALFQSLQTEGSAWAEGGLGLSPSSDPQLTPSPRHQQPTAGVETTSPLRVRPPSSGSRTPSPQRIVIPDSSPSSYQNHRSHQPGAFKVVRHLQKRRNTITPENALAMAYPEDGDHEVHPENRKIGFGSGQWGTLTNRHMMSNPDPLEPFFRTVRERNLIRHYCQTLTQIMMALPSSLNPILSIHLPIILSMPSTSPGSPPSQPTILLSPPTNPEFRGDIYSGEWSTNPNLFGDTMLSGGALEPSPEFPVALGSVYEFGYGNAASPTMHASVEALRLSVLGVAAIHQCYLLARSGQENRFKAMEMWNYASGMRVLAAQHLEYGASAMDGRMSDAALGASCTIALIDIFAGGHNFQGNMGVGRELIAARGGPAAMVQGSTVSMQETISPTLEGPVHFIEAIAHSSPDPNTGVYTPRRGVLISSARLLLEQLTVYDTFSTLTSGEQPALIRPNDWHWWHEGDNSNYHAFSVENMFGMSRSIVSLFSRVSAFLNRHSGRSWNGTLHTVDGHPTPDPTRSPTPTPSLADISPNAPHPSSPHSALYLEARSLLREVETWTDPPSSPHPRIKWGNGAHQWAMMILLLREAFNLRHDDPRVQQCAKLTLWATVKASDHFKMSVDLTWPVIIAGSQCMGQQRAASYCVLEGFRKQCCFDIDTSEQILKEVWMRMDAGLPRADFRSVVEDLGLRVLIL